MLTLSEQPTNGRPQAERRRRLDIGDPERNKTFLCLESQSSWE